MSRRAARSFSGFAIVPCANGVARATSSISDRLQNTNFPGTRKVVLLIRLPSPGGRIGPHPGLAASRSPAAFLIEARDKAGLRQIELAKRLRRSQSYVSYVETGQKLVDVVELMEWAEAIGFDAREAIKRLSRVPRK
jgi:hypothetical protein